MCYVTSRLPWPPNSGVERRIYQQFIMLRERYRVCLVTSDNTLDGSPAHEHLGALNELVDQVQLVTPEMNFVGLAEGLRRAWPLQVIRAYEPRLHTALRDAERRLDPVVTIYSLVRCAPYMEGRSVPAVLDFCDALSEQFRRRLPTARPAMKPVFALESRLLRTYESKCARAADSTMIVTEADARYVVGSPAVVPATFDIAEPKDGESDVPLPPMRAGHSLVFSGDMSTQYSETAALWFANSVLPLIHREEPSATFFVVGRSPTPGLLSLARGRTDIVVTGAVPRVSDYLERATVAVAPLRFGTGIKLKLLDAFAAGVALVGTSIADEGTGAAAYGAIAVADDPETFARHVLRLIRDEDARERQVLAGRRYALDRYDRRTVAVQLFQCIEDGVIRHQSRRDLRTPDIGAV